MTSSPLKIGLYGGSFDPIHNGHLILARDAMERLGLERVVFLPARISPHKLDHPPASPEARCEMLEKAIAGEPGFEMDACEIEREGPSFTVDTVAKYQEKYPGARLYYFIGDDNLAELDTWKDIKRLQETVQFVILSRAAGVPFLTSYPIINRHVEISSTEIRNRIARGVSVRYMVPVATCEVIKKMGLYRND